MKEAYDVKLEKLGGEGRGKRGFFHERELLQKTPSSHLPKYSVRLNEF
jgi:hypothetical protein